MFTFSVENSWFSRNDQNLHAALPSPALIKGNKSPLHENRPNWDFPSLSLFSLNKDILSKTIKITLVHSSQIWSPQKLEYKLGLKTKTYILVRNLGMTILDRALFFREAEMKWTDNQTGTVCLPLQSRVCHRWVVWS